MNETKTEFSQIYLAKATEIDSHGKALRGNESWEKNKTSGSLLCSTTDMHARQRKIQFVTETLDSAKQDPAEDKTASLQGILCINHALQLQQLGSTESHA
jgi:hypothetical protein